MRVRLNYTIYWWNWRGEKHEWKKNGGNCDSKSRIRNYNQIGDMQANEIVQASIKRCVKKEKSILPPHPKKQQFWCATRH